MGNWSIYTTFAYMHKSSLIKYIGKRICDNKYIIFVFLIQHTTLSTNELMIILSSIVFTANVLLPKKLIDAPTQKHTFLSIMMNLSWKESSIFMVISPYCFTYNSTSITCKFAREDTTTILTASFLTFSNHRLQVCLK